MLIHTFFRIVSDHLESAEIMTKRAASATDLGGKKEIMSFMYAVMTAIAGWLPHAMIFCTRVPSQSK